MLLIAQLLAGRVVGQYLGSGQQARKATGRQPMGDAVNQARH
jgi:hypothetical protein